MTRETHKICVLDTNVIYPIEIRDLLFWFAHDDLYIPKWSKHIFDEWVDVMNRKHVNAEEIRKRINMVSMAFPEAMVENYEFLISRLKLPDPKDCHVLAAAIQSNSNIIVTNNLKDFPEKYISNFGIVVKSADNFLSELIEEYPAETLNSFIKLVSNRRNPNLNNNQVIEALEYNRLSKTAKNLLSLL